MLQRATRERAAALGVGAAARAVRPGHRRAPTTSPRCSRWPPPSPGRRSSATGASSPASAGSAGPASWRRSGAAGDLFADGSIGSHTASPAPTRTPTHAHPGHGYLDAAGVRDHVVACTEAGLQAGFHAIGDGALDAVVAGLRRGRRAARRGPAAGGPAPHRARRDGGAGAPAGPGPARRGRLRAAGVRPALGRRDRHVRRAARRCRGRWPRTRSRRWQRPASRWRSGSDSPVTPIDPWGSVRAAVRHRTPGSGLDPVAAFDAHTRGGWWAARRDADGVVAAGAPATFAVWDVDELDPATGLPPLEEPDDGAAAAVARWCGEPRCTTATHDLTPRPDVRSRPCQRRLPDGVLCGERSAWSGPDKERHDGCTQVADRSRSQSRTARALTSGDAATPGRCGDVGAGVRRGARSRSVRRRHLRIPRRSAATATPSRPATLPLHAPHGAGRGQPGAHVLRRRPVPRDRPPPRPAHECGVRNLDRLDLQGSVDAVPTADGGSIIRGSGVTGFVFFPGDAGPGDTEPGRIYLFTGTFVATSDPSGAVTGFTSAGKRQDVCAMLTLITSVDPVGTPKTCDGGMSTAVLLRRLNSRDRCVRQDHRPSGCAAPTTGTAGRRRPGPPRRPGQRCGGRLRGPLLPPGPARSAPGRRPGRRRGRGDGRVRGAEPAVAARPAHRGRVLLPAGERRQRQPQPAAPAQGGPRAPAHPAGPRLRTGRPGGDGAPGARGGGPSAAGAAASSA